MRLAGIHGAARSGDIDEVRRRLDEGEDVNARGEGETTPLHWAVAWGKDEVAFLLLDRGADPNAADDEGNTPLFLGARKGYTSTDVVERLLHSPGIDVNAQNERGWTALHGASLRGRDDIVRLLLDAGARTDLRTAEGDTAYDLAAQKGRDTVIAVFDDRGIN